MALFALVQPGMATPAQLRTFQPVEHEQCPLDPSQFLECQVERNAHPLGGVAAEVLVREK